MPQIKTLALALSAAFSFAPRSAVAQDVAAPVPAEPSVALPAVTVTATRTERRSDDVPNTVTVKTAREIEAEGARDVKDLFRNEIDITVRAATPRFGAALGSTGRAGNEGINIRGLEGNQVLLLVDGIRVPNSFSFGAFATGRADFLALDAAQTIEVLRGPASTQYGSDGLAGAVSLRTLDPADLLRRGASTGGFARIGYASIDRSTGATLGAAVRRGDWEGLVVASTRRGHEVGNQGDDDAPDRTRTTPNPLDYRSTSLLVKGYWSATAGHRLGATVEALRRTQTIEVLSARAPPPPPPLAATSTLDLDADDRISRQRVSVDHRYLDPLGRLFQKAETRVYVQDADVRQLSIEDRNTAADRTRDNRYREKLRGLTTQLESRFDTGGAAQRLSWGVDASRATFTGERDGTVPPFGETFPAKPFPDTRYTLVGAFVQNEIDTGPVTIIPALRYDRYQLSPSAEGYSGGEVVKLSDHAVTPRLGIIWRLAPGFAPYGQIAKGFRAPTPDQVNNGFTNVASFYQSIGNPNLKAEHANSLELGARGAWGSLRWQLAGYDNRYDDFISQQVIAGSGTPGDPLIFQFVNLASARIRGIEVRAEWQIARQWLLNAGSALSRGYSDAGGGRVPLDTVEPLRHVLGLRFNAGAWQVRGNALYGQGKARDRIAPTATAPFTPPSYTVFDLGASWQPLPRLTLVANLNNVFDKTYWRWSDVRGVADSSTVKDAYTAPGRNFQVSLRYDF